MFCECLIMGSELQGDWMSEGGCTDLSDTLDPLQLHFITAVREKRINGSIDYDNDLHNLYFSSHCEQAAPVAIEIPTKKEGQEEEKEG